MVALVHSIWSGHSFALLIESGWKTAYIWSATASLITFYLFYFPAILFGELPVPWPALNPSVVPFNLLFNVVSGEFAWHG